MRKESRITPRLRIFSEGETSFSPEIIESERTSLFSCCRVPKIAILSSFIITKLAAIQDGVSDITQLMVSKAISWFSGSPAPCGGRGEGTSG